MESLKEQHSLMQQTLDFIPSHFTHAIPLLYTIDAVFQALEYLSYFLMSGRDIETNTRVGVILRQNYRFCPSHL